MTLSGTEIHTMNIETKDTTLVISGVHELTYGSTLEIKDRAKRLFLAPELINIDFDCASLDFIDSSGLGALISVQKLAGERGGKLRLLAPKPAVIQLLELTRLNRVFEVAAA
jgi:anti-anti-sigma factor